MASYIKKISEHIVAKNALSLLMLQLVTMVAPLLVLPFLSRILNFNNFGLLMVVFSIFSIGIVITDFGFNLYATYKIAENRDNKVFVGFLLGAIGFIKTFILLVIFLILFVLKDVLNFDYLLLSVIFLNLFSQAFLPTWFFQGIEKMKSITIYTVFGKMFYVTLVFYFVKCDADMPLVILFMALGNLLSNFIGLIYIYRNGYQFKVPSFIYIKEVLLESATFFASRAAVTIYTSASTFIVGAVAGPSQAAVFGSAEKIYQASQSLTLSISQAFFPFVVKTKNTKLLFFVVARVVIILFLMCFLLSFWSNEIMVLIFGPQYSSSGKILDLFFFITVINFISVNFGYPAFSSINRLEAVNKTVYLGGLVQILLLIILFCLNSVSAFTVACSVLFTELIVMLARIFLFNFYIKDIKSKH